MIHTKVRVIDRLIKYSHKVQKQFNPNGLLAEILCLGQN